MHIDGFGECYVLYGIKTTLNDITNSNILYLHNAIVFISI